MKEYNGCRVSTAEIVLKYYRALSASHERVRRIELKKNATNVLTTVDEPDDKVNYNDVLSVIRSELVDDNIESFVGIVVRSVHTNIGSVINGGESYGGVFDGVFDSVFVGGESDCGGFNGVFDCVFDGVFDGVTDSVIDGVFDGSSESDGGIVEG